MDPEIWGPMYWNVFHHFAKHCSITKKNKEQIKYFYNQFKVPCDDCQSKYDYIIKTFPIDSFLESNDKLYTWTSIIHDMINEKLGKKKRNYLIKKNEIKKGITKFPFYFFIFPSVMCFLFLILLF